jgi:hypothetical protein
MEPPQLQRVTRTLKRIAPLKAGIMYGVTLAILSLIAVPFFLLFAAFAPQLPSGQRVGIMAFGAGFAIMLPIIYGAVGFLIGVLSAFVYNVVAKFVGGIEFDVE